MTGPRLEVDLAKVEANARSLVERLGQRGIRVTGVTKATLGAPSVAEAFERGGVVGLGDSRVPNLRRLHAGGSSLPRTLLRSPMLSEVDAVVRHAAISLNTERTVIAALGAAATRQGLDHGVLLMVELGDLREGVAPGAVVGLAEQVVRQPGVHLAGIGTNLACQSGISPDQAKMDELSAVAADVESAIGHRLSVVSGGNSANLGWALTTTDVGRVDELRLGESILLGTDPLHRRPVDGLQVDACVLVGEVIEVQVKAAQPWGAAGLSAFGAPVARSGAGRRQQVLLAVGRQDVDPDGLVPPPGCTVLGASSDHLVVDAGDGPVAVGDEVAFGLDYSALVRAMTSPFVVKHLRRPEPSSPPA